MKVYLVVVGTTAAVTTTTYVAVTILLIATAVTDGAVPNQLDYSQVRMVERTQGM